MFNLTHNFNYKFLLIRFSSFGDIVASLSLAEAIKRKFPTAEIHWVTRSDYAETASCSKNIFKVWSLDRKKGMHELLQISLALRKEKFTHIYDAHNNTRSHFIVFFLTGPFHLFSFLMGRHFLRRSTYRWRRFLLFNFHINLYPYPFSGQFALLEPLKHWGISTEIPTTRILEIPEFARNQAFIFAQFSKVKSGVLKIALSPSASYPLKRWPVESWESLIELHPEAHFFLLGGPEDTFISEINKKYPDRTTLLAGKLSYLESAAVIELCDLLVSNDTGLMHVAEQLDKNCIALMGPAPFGFPARSKTKILEINLECRPCSKHGQGPCTNATYQKCLRDILPTDVSKEIRKLYV